MFRVLGLGLRLRVWGVSLQLGLRKKVYLTPKRPAAA